MGVPPTNQPECFVICYTYSTHRRSSSYLRSELVFSKADVLERVTKHNKSIDCYVDEPHCSSQVPADEAVDKMMVNIPVKFTYYKDETYISLHVRRFTLPGGDNEDT